MSSLMMSSLENDEWKEIKSYDVSHIRFESVGKVNNGKGPLTSQ